MARTRIPSGRLKSFAAEKLPQYMVPSYFIQLEEFPLTPSGKIDRIALPLSQDAYRQDSSAGGKPAGETEQIIAGVWKEILRQDQVGIEQNFFDLGGKSLDILRLQNRLRDLFDTEISLGEILANPTVRFLARYFEQDEDENIET
ncbi:MAG: non-ribosomal peptide synthetase, partial [bacterium]|nr:non-ribosomal peptide synthetase [bacterium]